MAKKEESVSEYLARIGRKGGEATGNKGLAAMSPEQRAKVIRKGLETRRANAAKRAAAKRAGKKAGKKSG